MAGDSNSELPARTEVNESEKSNALHVLPADSLKVEKLDSAHKLTVSWHYHRVVGPDTESMPVRLSLLNCKLNIIL